MEAREGSKIFNDPVIGHFRLSTLAVAIVDTPHFQRLRNLKQLGLAYYVFPGATHTRFEHSLGVANCGAAWARKLSQDLEQADIQAVEIAGLCHDVGHGPFSHAFENELWPRLFGRRAARTWCHEEMSTKLIDKILDDNSIDVAQYGLSEQDVQNIKTMMVGDRPTAADNAFLWDIVANKRSGIDVDKFDYLARDSYFTGVKTSFDKSRIMEFSKVMENEIVLKWTEWNNVFSMFEDRVKMHKSVYIHRKIKAVEFMVMDALAEAAAPLELRAWLTDADLSRWTDLDDSVLGTLRRLRPERCEDPAAVQRAQALLMRIERRQLYAFVGEVLLPPDVELPAPEDITTCQGGFGQAVNLQPEDIVVSEAKVNFCCQERNPLERVRWYTSNTQCGYLRPPDVSSMLPQAYQDRRVRVYSKDNSPAVVRAVEAALDTWMRRHNREPASMLTPSKKLCRDASNGHGAANGTGSGAAKRRRADVTRLPPIPMAPIPE